MTPQRDCGARGLGPALAVALACAACGGDDDGMMMMRRDAGPARDAGMAVPPANASPQVAFEGQERLAIDITAGMAHDFTGATISPEAAPSPLEVVEQRCTADRCGVVLRVLDTRGNLGEPIPPPIDAENHFLRVRTPDQEWRVLISVRPLDMIRNGGTDSLPTAGIIVASSIEAVPGSGFEASPMRQIPIRWVIFGGGEMHGTLDVSAVGAEGRVGGSSGGAPGTTGEGGGRGAAGTGGAGAGGGGAGEVGEAGQGAGGVPGGGGAGGPADIPSGAPCVTDFDDNECGGSGGGGAGGFGGGGAGTALVVSIEPLDLGGATLRARGGDGMDGGGGGSGGVLVVAAPSWTAPDTIDVSGGAGGTMVTTTGAGGAGGAGRARVDVPSGDTVGALIGPAVDLSSLQQVTDVQALTLTGRAEPNSRIEVRDAIAPVATFMAMADATGAFSVDVTLLPGINRLSVTSTGTEGPLRSWSGTNVQFDQVPGYGVIPVPIGATIDVVYLP